MSRHQSSAVTSLAPDSGGWDWRRDAACRDEDPEKFYGFRDSDPGAEPAPWEWEALTVCFRCPVATPCLASALAEGGLAQWGVRGQMTAGQRKNALRHRRDRAAREAS